MTWEAHAVVLEGLGGPPEGLGEVRRPSWWAVRSREAYPRFGMGREFQEGLGGPPLGLGGVGRQTRRFGRGREAYPEV